MKKLLLIIVILYFSISYSFADQYVPEFDKMKLLRCDVVETVYQNEQGKAVTGYYRIFRLDDEYQNIYLEKDFINGLSYYGDDKIIYNEQTMTDFSIVSTHVEIDRQQMKYQSSSRIEYDNPDFGVQDAVGIGSCKYLN